MDEERLREWVEKKLDDGISEDRIRKSLRNTGHDPSIVDEVQDPFSGSKEEESKLDLSEEPEEEEKSQEPDDRNSVEEKDSGFSFQDSGPESPAKDSKDTDSGSGGFSLPSPDLSLPSVPLKAVAVVIGVVIAVGGYFFVPQGMIPELSLNKVSTPDVEAPDVKMPEMPESSGDDTDQESQGSKVEDAGCDVGLRINSVSSDNGRTVAEVFVTRGKTDVVLEIYSGEDLEGSKTARIGGTGSLTVGSTGDTAVLHPEGCEKPRTSAAIN